MKKVLITGFDPFNKESINPSWEVAKRLAKPSFIYAVQLPCVFDLVLEVLQEKIKEIQPDIVICIGQAARQSDIAIERVAINLNDATIPDNQNNQPIDTEIIPHAPSAYFSTLPCKTIVQALKENGIPASLSLSAGTYVCNHTMYGLLHFLAKHLPNCRGGFIHIPFLPEQGVNHPNAPTMALETVLKGISIAINVALETE
ncbi:pyroglutamyl-peptidase I [Vespertiliibacter pulmonis]|uniref:Pyrrolidone-carboxylate peptidase n=1 Tax=Vespertiliibacter pulmonis TaxID=1443036 RepID=A0A3N4WDZ5_9PAST|nr:pyroglutamyl-peptidase I [Vespertiliibacter pulmonis]QLB20824.1 pyroglutamyl-peptidase I [Vespertiliibacter pulmonis]RPE83474.1 pyroglutamyl-peptidase I [Vespertiliibacter pulmonis]